MACCGKAKKLKQLKEKRRKQLAELKRKHKQKKK